MPRNVVVSETKAQSKCLCQILGLNRLQMSLGMLFLGRLMAPLQNGGDGFTHSVASWPEPDCKMEVELVAIESAALVEDSGLLAKPPGKKQPLKGKGLQFLRVRRGLAWLVQLRSMQLRFFAWGHGKVSGISFAPLVPEAPSLGLTPQGL